MKMSGFFHRCFCFILICMLLIPVAFAETVDLSSMTDEEVVALLTRVNEEIISRGINKPQSFHKGDMWPERISPRVDISLPVWPKR